MKIEIQHGDGYSVSLELDETQWDHQTEPFITVKELIQEVVRHEVRKVRDNKP